MLRRAGLRVRCNTLIYSMILSPALSGTLWAVADLPPESTSEPKGRDAGRRSACKYDSGVLVVPLRRPDRRRRATEAIPRVSRSARHAAPCLFWTAEPEPTRSDGG